MKPKILIVDDNEEYSELLGKQICEQLTSLVDIEYSNNIRDAKTRIQANHYDIATIDMNLPVTEGSIPEDISGMELVPELRISNCQCSIIVMTGETRLDQQDEIINWSFDKGASDIVLKEARKNYIGEVATSVEKSINHINKKNHYAKPVSGDTVIVFLPTAELIESFSNRFDMFVSHQVNSLSQAINVSDDSAVCACIVVIHNDDSSWSTFIKRFHSAREDIPIVVITAEPSADADQIIAARKLGAVSAVRHISHGMEVLKKALCYREKQLSRFNNIIGQHPSLLKAKGIAYIAAHKTAPILILGASGTGKELMAKGISDLVSRDGPYININCAAIPKELLESELFGHEKGAFTGAEFMKKGLFEQALGGTIFLDEIGELSLGLQAKILKVIEDKSMRRVGGLKEIDLQVKIVAATNTDIRVMVEKGVFRNDLYQRLKVFTVVMPPLMERVSDIPFLVYYFVDQISKREKQCLLAVDDDAMQLIKSKDWSQGNIRGLKNVLELIMALIHDKKVVISRDDVEKAFNEYLTTTLLENVDELSIDELLKKIQHSTLNSGDRESQELWNKIGPNSESALSEVLIRDYFNEVGKKEFKKFMDKAKLRKKQDPAIFHCLKAFLYLSINTDYVYQCTFEDMLSISSGHASKTLNYLSCLTETILISKQKCYRIKPHYLLKKKQVS